MGGGSKYTFAYPFYAQGSLAPSHGDRNPPAARAPCQVPALRIPGGFGVASGPPVGTSMALESNHTRQTAKSPRNVSHRISKLIRLFSRAHFYVNLLRV